MKYLLNCKFLTYNTYLDDPIPESLSLKREEEDEDDDMARKINFTEENYSKYSDNNTLHLIGNNKL